MKAYVVFGMMALMLSASAFASAPKVFGISLNTKKAVSKPTARAGQCVSFDGNYEGRCDNSPDLKSLKIEQMGCDQVKIDGEKVAIGAIVTESTSQQDQSSSSTKFAQWDDKQESLSLYQFGYYQMGSNGTLPYILAATLTDTGSGLLLEGTLEDEKVSCNYQRK